ncbi:MAG: peroxiredoxin family protein [Rhodanobacter sp.]
MNRLTWPPGTMRCTIHSAGVALHAFQMLCPACVAHALPQAQRLTAAMRGQPLAVIGLHTVFEHHAVMTREALAAFVHEYRLRFPIGIDAPDDDGAAIPQTMRIYAMQGTPSTLLIDAEGRLRRQWFGSVDDLVLGVELGRLLAEA